MPTTLSQRLEAELSFDVRPTHPEASTYWRSAALNVARAAILLLQGIPERKVTPVLCDPSQLFSLFSMELAQDGSSPARVKATFFVRELNDSTRARICRSIQAALNPMVAAPALRRFA